MSAKLQRKRSAWLGNEEEDGVAATAAPVVVPAAVAEESFPDESGVILAPAEDATAAAAAAADSDEDDDELEPRSGAVAASVDSDFEEDAVSAPKSACTECGGRGIVRIRLEREDANGKSTAKLPAKRFRCPLQCANIERPEQVPEIWRGFINGVHSEAHWATLLRHCQQNNQLLVADFTGPWCGPSRQCCPKLTEIADHFNNVVFVKLQIDPHFQS
jgi:thiol-disulfide isomerase/thioredoxin